MSQWSKKQVHWVVELLLPIPMLLRLPLLLTLPLLAVPRTHQQKTHWTVSLADLLASIKDLVTTASSLGKHHKEGREEPQTASARNIKNLTMAALLATWPCVELVIAGPSITGFTKARMMGLTHMERNGRNSLFSIFR
jgi:hypothetical protein